MQKAHIHLVKFALSQECTISVYDGEEWQVKRSTSFKAIKDALESVDQASMVIQDNEGQLVASAVVVDDCTFEPDETVVDHSDTVFMRQWEWAYELA